MPDGYSLVVAKNPGWRRQSWKLQRRRLVVALKIAAREERLARIDVVVEAADVGDLNQRRGRGEVIRTGVISVPGGVGVGLGKGIEVGDGGGVGCRSVAKRRGANGVGGTAIESCDLGWSQRLVSVAVLSGG
jgi:hypothetical protein